MTDRPVAFIRTSLGFVNLAHVLYIAEHPGSPDDIRRLWDVFNTHGQSLGYFQCDNIRELLQVLPD